MRCVLCAAFAAMLPILVPSSSSAWQKPDFSGTWVVISPEVAAGQQQIVTQDAATLTRSHASQGGGHRFKYPLDGSETRLSVTSHHRDIPTLAKAAWDGDTLVLTEATIYPDGRKRNARSVWSLDAQGRLIVELTEQFEGQPATTRTLISARKTFIPDKD